MKTVSYRKTQYRKTVVVFVQSTSDSTRNRTKFGRALFEKRRAICAQYKSVLTVSLGTARATLAKLAQVAIFLGDICVVVTASCKQKHIA